MIKSEHQVYFLGKNLENEGIKNRKFKTEIKELLAVKTVEGVEMKSRYQEHQKDEKKASKRIGEDKSK